MKRVNSTLDKSSAALEVNVKAVGRAAVCSMFEKTAAAGAKNSPAYRSSRAESPPVTALAHIKRSGGQAVFPLCDEAA